MLSSHARTARSADGRDTAQIAGVSNVGHSAALAHSLGSAHGLS